jgi:hypothetical protein
VDACDVDTESLNQLVRGIQAMVTFVATIDMNQNISERHIPTP